MSEKHELHTAYINAVVESDTALMEDLTLTNNVSRDNFDPLTATLNDKSPWGSEKPELELQFRTKSFDIEIWLDSPEDAREFSDWLDKQVSKYE